MKRRILSIALLLSTFVLTEQANAQLSPTTKADSLSLKEQGMQLIKEELPPFTPIEMPASGDAPAWSFTPKFDFESEPFTVRDGGTIMSYHFPQESKTTIVFLHGVMGSGYLLNEAAGMLREVANAEVYALDLRGHGQSSGTPGDVDYIGQYTDDVVDVIKQIKAEKPENKIVLAGHSMGGGVSLRYAELTDRPEVDAYLLFAPHLGHNAPTLPQPSDDNGEAAAFMQINIPRIIGLNMLNAVGDHSHDDLPVMVFNLPKEVPMRQYTYRATQSSSPLDYASALQSVDKPMLVLVGNNDEAFRADQFEAAITANSDGQVFLFENVNHDGIKTSKEAIQKAANWLENMNFVRNNN